MLCVLHVLMRAVCAVRAVPCGWQVLRDGVLYSQSFSRGNPTTTLTEQPAPPESYSRGTKVGVMDPLYPSPR